MAINFPPITVTGQTYDYQGIRYTADFTVAPGFWQVTTPGTFGVASSAEVDAGTDAVKYVSPAALESSKYNDVQASDVTFDDSANGIGTDVQSGMDILAQRANPNLFINGEFRIWQRGVSAAIPASGFVYLPDRFRAFENVAVGVASAFQQRIGLIHEFSAGILMNSTGARTGFEQRVEAILTGKTMTATYWLVGAAGIVLEHRYVGNDGVGAITDSITLDGTLQKFTTTFTIGSGAVTADFCPFNLVPTAGTVTAGDAFEVHEAKLEYGSVSTPNISRLVGEELALCRRYYRNDVRQISAGWDSTFLQLRAGIAFDAMRAVPNIILSSWISIDHSNWNGNGSIVVSSSTGGFAYITAADTAYRTFSVVAQVTYTADAEL